MHVRVCARARACPLQALKTCEDVDDVSAAHEKTSRGYLTIPAMEGQETANPSAAERVQARSSSTLTTCLHRCNPTPMPAATVAEPVEQPLPEVEASGNAGWQSARQSQHGTCVLVDASAACEGVSALMVVMFARSVSKTKLDRGMQQWDSSASAMDGEGLKRSLHRSHECGAKVRFICTGTVARLHAQMPHHCVAHHWRFLMLTTKPLIKFLFSLHSAPTAH